jgi:methyl-accepting chemotaxis protein
VNKLSLKAKLGVGFGTVLFILAMMGIIAYYTVEKLTTLSREVEDRSHKVELAKSIELAVMKESSGARGFIVLNEEDILQRYEQGKSGYTKSVGELATMVTTEAEKKALAEVGRTYDVIAAVFEKEIALRRSGETKDAMDMMSAGAAANKDVAKAVEDFIAIQEKGKKEALAEQNATDSEARAIVLSLAVVGLLAGFGVAILIARSITGSLGGMLSLIRGIAENNLTMSDLAITSQDDIGRAGAELNTMKNNLHTVIQSIRATAEQVAAASEELSATGQQIMSNSEETTAQAKVASEAGGQVNSNLQTLASGAEEMNSTIGEIAKNAGDAARVAGEAVQAAEHANQTVAKLGDSSAEIEKVIEVITSIAQQTNLLALNATIEAARAGEAGKGFAVVANEVKELAKQTAKATEEIKQKIGAIRENTGGAVGAIGGIKGVIDKVSQISTTIATAVEEQSATTSEMTRNVTEAARGASTISESIKGVAEAAQSTSTNVGESQTATEHLSKMANELRDLVGQFKVSAENSGRASPTSFARATGHAAGAH